MNAVVFSRWLEMAALTVLVLLVAVGGKPLLANLALHRIPSASVLAALIVLALVRLRRTYLGSSDDTRLAVTQSVAYLVAAVLALWDILAPAKWLPGSCIAAVEVALVFDVVTIAARRQTKET